MGAMQRLIALDRQHCIVAIVTFGFPDVFGPIRSCTFFHDFFGTFSDDTIPFFTFAAFHLFKMRSDIIETEVSTIHLWNMSLGFWSGCVVHALTQPQLDKFTQ
jgi:hypothetical protein